MLRSLWESIPWVFEGVGVAALGWLGLWYSRRRRARHRTDGAGTHQAQRGGRGSVNLQAGKDLHLNLKDGETRRDA